MRIDSVSEKSKYTHACMDTYTSLGWVGVTKIALK